MKTTNNKQQQVGANTESEIIKFIRSHGYWIYNTPHKLEGSQPVDLICIKENKGFLIDAKHVREEEKSFPFSRIEANQITTLSYARDFAKIPPERLGFAILFDRTHQIYYMTYNKYEELSSQGYKSVSLDVLRLLEEVL